MVDYEALGRRLKAKRRAMKLTQEQLAKAVQISMSFYGNIERGNRVPSVDTLVALANVLNVGTDYLLMDSVQVAKRQLMSRSESVKLQRYLRDVIEEIAYDTEHE